MMGLTPLLEGGSDRHIFEISSRMQNCYVFTQKGSICKNKIEAPVIKKPQLLKSFSFFFSAFIYSMFLIFNPRKKFDVIHIHENLLYFLAPLLRLRYEVVIAVHGIKGFKFYDNKKIWPLFRTALKSSDKLIAVNIEDQKILKRDFKKVYYIPNGVDLSAYKNINPNIKKNIVFIGRVHEQKGILYLLEAFNKIKGKNNFELEIIGKIDEYGEKLRRKYADPRIKWVGFISKREEIVRKLKSAYCIALPSLWEGLPLTLFEALASSRPVIVSDIGAYKSVIKDQALFCKVKDSNDLAKKILFLFNNKKRADEIGKKGEKLSRDFDWKSIADKTIKVYNE